MLLLFIQSISEAALVDKHYTHAALIFKYNLISTCQLRSTDHETILTDRSVNIIALELSSVIWFLPCKVYS